MTKMQGAQVLMECLRREGVEVIFGYPGGANLPIYDALTGAKSIKHILVRHEQAAAHAADGYARVSGKVGVCFGTSGPGATNLVTGIANAWMDSVPMVIITGAVVSGLIGRDGFQEADITGITLPITKHNSLVLDPNEIARAVREAFYLASTGRKGPVLVDIPRDVLQQVVEFHWPEKVEIRTYRPTTHGHPAQIKKAAAMIAESKKPLILAGHGCVQAQAHDELLAVAEKADIPVINTLLGLGSFPGSHPLFMGMPGMHGMYWNNMAICEADLIIGAGMRFDDRVTGRLKDFAPNARIIHIDIDPAEIGKNVQTHVPIVGDVKEVLGQLARYLQPARHEEWVAWFAEMRERHPSITIGESETVLPQFVIKKIYEAMGNDGYVVTGVGQHQMWAAQFYWSDKKNGWVTSGGLGTMGFEVPAAMGVQLAFPKDLVWSICGDGGFQMTLQELATIVDYELPIKFAIINNASLGMVRQWQELFYAGNISESKQSNPDFVKLAEAFGMRGLRVTQQDEVEDAIAEANRYPGPILIDFQVDKDENVYPMVPPGASLQETVDLPAIPTMARGVKI
ncbi:MAG: biosynthetic-type acetolactate synthase large subunit [Dehalococcoidia bacterium]